MSRKDHLFDEILAVAAKPVEDLPRPMTDRTELDSKPGRPRARLSRFERKRNETLYNRIYERRPGVGWLIREEDGNTNIIVTDMTNIGAERALADTFTEFANTNPGAHLTVTNTDGRYPSYLMGYLAAWGFDISFGPAMAADLHNLSEDFPVSPMLKIEVCETGTGQEPFPHPFHMLEPSPEGLSRRRAKVEMRPQRSWFFLANLKDKVVGRSELYIQDNGLPAIDGVDVIPEERRQGIGSAISLAPCLFARELGYRYCVLGSSPMAKSVYERIGFWVAHKFCHYAAQIEELKCPTGMDLEIAGAASSGNRSRFAALVERDPAALNWPLGRHFHPVAIAAMVGREDFVRWLMDQGADLDPVSAYRLGWIDQLARIARETADLLNAKISNHGSTVLHAAVLDADAEMVKTLLALGADPEVEDDIFAAPAIDWARHFGFQKIADILEDFQNAKVGV